MCVKKTNGGTCEDLPKIRSEMRTMCAYIHTYPIFVINEIEVTKRENRILVDTRSCRGSAIGSEVVLLGAKVSCGDLTAIAAIAIIHRRAVPATSCCLATLLGLIVARAHSIHQGHNGGGSGQKEGVDAHHGNMCLERSSNLCCACVCICVRVYRRRGGKWGLSLLFA